MEIVEYDRMIPLSIRPATLLDAQIAVHLIHIAKGRFTDYQFGSDAKNVLNQLFIRPKNRLSHQFADIAGVNGKIDGKIAGLLLSYPGSRLKQVNEFTGRQMVTICGVIGFVRYMRKVLPFIFCSGAEAEADEYFINVVAVMPDFQGKGIGTHLMRYAEEKARAEGLRKCALSVEIENHRARYLYERLGFQVVNTVKLKWLERLIGISGFHRMVKGIE
jgi:ribosomal protein S18 acetylase RimI-like enzyme